MFGKLVILDNALLILYFVGIISIGLYFRIRKDSSINSYFLGDKKVGWIALGLSLFATNISSEHLYGLSEAGAKYGLAVGQFEWLAIIFLVLLGWVFAPIFIKAGILTVPEYIGLKLGSTVRRYVAALSVFIYLFTKISITLYAGAIILQRVLDWDMGTSVILMVLFTGIYTVIGGFRSVLYTQVIQSFFIILSALILVYFGIDFIGGWNNFVSALPASHFDLVKPFDDPDLPFFGVLLGAPILGVWYWCMDQYIVQRILGTKDLKEIKKGTLLASFLKSLPIFLFILPGMIAVAIFPEINGENAYATLINSDIIPIGFKGLVLIGLFSALMSSLSSAFNSTAAIITNDLFKYFIPNPTVNQINLVARLSTILTVLITIFIAHSIDVFDSGLYIFLQSIQAYFSPPIFAAFLSIFIIKKINSKAVIVSLISGGLVGILRLWWDIAEFQLGSEISSGLNIFETNYLYFAFYLFSFCFLIIVIGSLVNQKD